ncbi:hypothetical protein ACFX2J_039648 [Malus domestica]
MKIGMISMEIRERSVREYTHEGVGSESGAGSSIDLDCRMGRMKSNCRKAAMETQQQHIQVDLVLTLMVKFYGGSIFMRELCFQASPKRLQKDRCLDGSGRRSRECCEEGK